MVDGELGYAAGATVHGKMSKVGGHCIGCLRRDYGLLECDYGLFDLLQILTRIFRYHRCLCSCPPTRL